MQAKSQTPKYNSFDEFYVYGVKELIRANPDFIRLDGLTTGGSRKPFAFFKYREQWWKVDEDTWIEKLNIAYDLMLKGQDPFVIEETTSKKNKCLTIVGQPKRPKNFYIYSD